MSNKLDIATITDKATIVLRKVSRYRLFIFIVFVVLVYGFLILRINTLTGTQPSSDAIASQSDPIKTAHVDKSVVKQLQSLQDNSVNVKTLFDQARSNPFQEQ